jgi:hypothetical protein
MAESIDNVFADEMYARAKKRAQQVYDRIRDVKGEGWKEPKRSV